MGLQESGFAVGLVFRGFAVWQMKPKHNCRSMLCDTPHYEEDLEEEIFEEIEEEPDTIQFFKSSGNEPNHAEENNNGTKSS